LQLLILIIMCGNNNTQTHHFGLTFLKTKI
jgi:hypothetical protein